MCCHSINVPAFLTYFFALFIFYIYIYCIRVSLFSQSSTYAHIYHSYKYRVYRHWRFYFHLWISTIYTGILCRQISSTGLNIVNNVKWTYVPFLRPRSAVLNKLPEKCCHTTMTSATLICQRQNFSDVPKRILYEYVGCCCCCYWPKRCGAYCTFCERGAVAGRVGRLLSPISRVNRQLVYR